MAHSTIALTSTRRRNTTGDEGGPVGMQHLEGEGGDAQQIGGPEMVSVIAKERMPGLTR